MGFVVQIALILLRSLLTQKFPAMQSFFFVEVCPHPYGVVNFQLPVPRAKALRYMPASLRDAFSSTRKAGASM